jgi:8-oxo-dGTP pyrophosphatase MutT (NUDIX family)
MSRSRSKGNPQRTEYHHSAGGLVLRDGEILLISTRKGRRWQLPKGHLEPGETPEQAAVRETREETGVRGRVRAPLPQISYRFVERGVRIEKKVDYFLLDFEEGDVANFDRKEVSGAAWFLFDEGIRRLSFDNERRVAEAALALVTPEAGR